MSPVAAIVNRRGRRSSGEAAVGVAAASLGLDVWAVAVDTADRDLRG
jgi:hypothetical protein